MCAPVRCMAGSVGGASWCFRRLRQQPFARFDLLRDSSGLFCESAGLVNGTRDLVGNVCGDVRGGAGVSSEPVECFRSAVHIDREASDRNDREARRYFAAAVNGSPVLTTSVARTLTGASPLLMPSCTLPASTKNESPAL